MKETNRKTRGSISLFLVIVIVAVTFLELTLISAGRQYDLELRAARAADLASDAILASYDKDLAREYGLLAVSDASLPLTVKAYIDDDLKQYPAQIDFDFETGSPLTDPAVLREQISSYLKLLYPQMMLTELMNKLDLLEQMGVKAEKAASDGDLIDIEEIETNGSLSNQLLGLIGSSTVQAGIGGLSNFLGDQEGGDAAHILRNYFKQEADDYDGEGSYEAVLSEEEQAIGDALLGSLGQFETVNEGGLGGIAEALSYGIDLLDIPTNNLYDRLLTAEYIVRMGANWSDQRQKDGLGEQRENIRGIKIDSISRYRELETEFIISGVENELGQKAAMSLYLGGSRLALRLLGLMMNETEMQSIEAWATILSVGLALVSGGSFAVEPSTLKYIIVYLRAQIEAVEDVNDLLDGRSVELLPYMDGVDIDSDYLDYLRFFVLFGNEDEQLKRLGETIEKNYIQTYHTSVITKMHFRSETISAQNFTLLRHASFVSYEEEQDE